jgi:glycosyltransferase involved in cell wall biosynthesis
LSVIREFDLTVVRGETSRRFLSANGIDGSVVITGSVNAGRVRAKEERRYDLMFVGQLIERKQPLKYLEIVEGARRVFPSLRAGIIGDGPLMEEVRSTIVRLGLAENVVVLGMRPDVDACLSQSKVFVLTSRDEGLPIALAEAMMGGSVPVVANVGDSGDLVSHGVNGYLVDPEAIREYVDHVETLLLDPETWGRLSERAIESAKAYVSVERVTELWSRHIRECISRPQPVAAR